MTRLYNETRGQIVNALMKHKFADRVQDIIDTESKLAFRPRI